jgi:hypothetical protein
MSLKSRFKLENPWMFITSLFYLIAGVMFFYILALEPGLFHLGLLGALSLTSAYGTLKARRWTLWFVTALFIIGTSFALITLYYSMKSFGSFFPNTEVGLLNTCLVIYTVLTWTFSIYVMAKRKTLEY